jgi:hypothetical protein
VENIKYLCKTLGYNVDMAGGRPTVYRPEFPIQVRRLVSTGASWRQVADYFGVAVSTIVTWTHKHPDFRAALKTTKDEADLAVENALWQRATGYTVDSVKIMSVDGKAVKVPFQEHIAPDVNAIKFWLTNRKPKDWREKTATEISGAEGGPIEVSSLSDAELEAIVRAHMASTK